ncbi:MAG TPA: serine/threonine-protein kinase [Pseudacidobacterium sp.]|nr:serine/threonine-protein kinase [Pseudacidobacterium sp.]
MPVRSPDQMPMVDVQEVRERLSVILAGKYRILSQLGAGGMATVWLALHRAHGALLAIKVLHPSFAKIPELREAFRREAIHTAKLADHPNIVPIFDVGESDALHYLVMPYISGCDLDEALRRCGRFHLEDTLTVALETVKTLAYAEEKGILHGDLTLGNIRIDHFGRILVLDFGLSQPLVSHNGINRFKIGTPYAMSPERIRGDVPDIRSDLYSLGILLLHLGSGHSPFEGKTIEEIEDQHLHRVLPIPNALREAHHPFSHLLERFLAKDPKDRPSNAQAVERELQAMGAMSRSLNITSLFSDSTHVPLRRRLSDLTEQVN